MTRDKTVDNKTRTQSTSRLETLANEKLCFFYYLRVALWTPMFRPSRRASRRGASDRTAGKPSGERNLFGAWGENGVIDARRGAKRLKRTLAGVEESGVAHDVADRLRCADNVGVATGRLKYA